MGRAQQQQQQTQPGAGIVIQVNGQPNDKDALHLNLDTSLQYSQRNGLSPARLTPDTTQRTLQFDLRASPEPRAISPAPSSQTSGTKNKLRKPRPDGYESDGGYMSEGGKAKKEKKEKEKKEKKSKKKGKDKDGNGGGEGGGVTDYESDGGYLSEASAKRKKSKKEKKEKEKSKAKSGESPATDYETDRGYASSFTRSLSRKQSSITSPVSGDESDGGYISESSKKRRFFRINSKSRKKQDSLDSVQEQPPPVPALPFVPLPIHEKFSRATSPLPRDGSMDTRPSVETVTSADTITSADTATSRDTSLTLDTTSTVVEPDDKRESPSSTEGLTRAFADADSVRSPSIDLLSAFRRQAADSRPSSPLSPSKFNPFTLRPTSPLSPKSSAVPALSPSKSIRARPKISAPNTTTLAPKHVPVPLTLTPPTPTSFRYPSNQIPPSPDGDYVLVTPNPYSTLSAEPSSPNGGPAPAAVPPPPSPKLQRPKVLAYYDLPPPSPPPRGPLPDVPQDISRSTSPSWSVAESSRLSRSAPADTNDPRNIQQQRDVPTGSPPRHPNTAAHPLSREIAGAGIHDVPTIAQPVPPTQRGRVSPFPTAPLLPREQTTPLMRKTSTMTREAVNRALNQNAPASASPYVEGHGRWSSHDQVRGPASAQLYPASGSNWPAGRHVRFAPPRSVSAMDTRRPEVDGSSSDDGRSWLAYDDDENGAVSDQSLSVPPTRPGSAEPASPDVNAILAGFRAQRDAELSARQDQGRRRATQADTLAGIIAEYERETMYLDVDEGGGDRASVWSEANSRHSFLDSEKSAAIREKLVKRVEAMYGKELVPPMPRLDPGLSSRSG